MPACGDLIVSRFASAGAGCRHLRGFLLYTRSAAAGTAQTFTGFNHARRRLASASYTVKRPATSQPPRLPAFAVLISCAVRHLANAYGPRQPSSVAPRPTAATSAGKPTNVVRISLTTGHRTRKTNLRPYDDDHPAAHRRIPIRHHRAIPNRPLAKQPQPISTRLPRSATLRGKGTANIRARLRNEARKFQHDRFLII